MGRLWLSDWIKCFRHPTSSSFSPFFSFPPFSPSSLFSCNKCNSSDWILLFYSTDFGEEVCGPIYWNIWNSLQQVLCRQSRLSICCCVMQAQLTHIKLFCHKTHMYQTHIKLHSFVNNKNSVNVTLRVILTFSWLASFFRAFSSLVSELIWNWKLCWRNVRPPLGSSIQNCSLNPWKDWGAKTLITKIWSN